MKFIVEVICLMRYSIVIFNHYFSKIEDSVLFERNTHSVYQIYFQFFLLAFL